MVYGEKDPHGGVWYTARTVDEIDEIIDEHLVKGNVINSLLLPRKS